MTLCWRPGAHVLHQKLEDEVVLLNLATGVYYRLDAVGARVWELVVAGHAQGEVAAQLMREYAVAAAQAAADVTHLLQELEAHGLLQGDAE